MENVSNLIPFTTFGILKGMKSAGGKPTTFPTLNDFITWARFTSGDMFATESEEEMLKRNRECAFDVVKGYITKGVVQIADLNSDERSVCGACAICGLIEGCHTSNCPNDEVVIQDDGSGNQVTASGRVLR